MKKYQRHNLSRIFPEMSKKEKIALVISMRTHGFDPAFRILLYEGQIIDGWHRYEAALEAGVEPLFDNWTGTRNSLVDFVMTANAVRRHLSGAALSLALSKAASMLGEKRTVRNLAKQSGASESTVSRAMRLQETDPEVAEKVARGEITFHDATRNVLKEEDKVQRASLVGGFPHVVPKTLVGKIEKARMGLNETTQRFIRNAIKERLERVTDT